MKHGKLLFKNKNDATSLIKISSHLVWHHGVSYFDFKFTHYVKLQSFSIWYEGSFIRSGKWNCFYNFNLFNFSEILKSPEVQRDKERYRKYVQQVIAFMTLGIDVSSLFSEMIMVMIFIVIIYIHYFCIFHHNSIPHITQASGLAETPYTTAPPWCPFSIISRNSYFAVKLCLRIIFRASIIDHRSLIEVALNLFLEL